MGGNQMTNDEDDLVVSVDSDDEVTRAEKSYREIAENEDLEWVRSVSMGLIIVGSLLGLWFGILLFSASPQDVLNSALFTSDEQETVNGQVLSALDEVNLTGGEPVENVQITILELDGQSTLHETSTNRDGRFSLIDIPSESLILQATYPGNHTLHITFNPGDQADLLLTLSPGDSIIEEDWRRNSHLDDAVLLASIISGFTVISALLGLIGAAEIKRGQHYRRCQYLCGFALFSRGGIFIGPLLILAGMGMLAGTKHQFADVESDEA